jgi:thiamine pyrophosphate-dependent acetolactate synthase large subunit-like protein
MATMTTAEAVISRLEAHGVRHVFGIPGTHNLPLYRHLAEARIDHVLPRHEQGAGYAADGYARSGAGPGVCLATSGPGVLNLAAAIGTAYADSIPMLILAPGMSSSVAGRDTGFLHETRDQIGAIAAIAGSAVRAEGPGVAALAVDAAFERFASGRPRPAYVEIPLDAMDALGEVPSPAPPSSGPPVADPGRIAEAAELLHDAGRVVLLLGGGAAKAGREAMRLAHTLGAPVLTTANGKGTVPETDPLSLGASIRLPSAQRLLAECDVVVAVGTELAESDLWHDAPLAFEGSLVRIDIDPGQRNKNAPATVAIVADAATALGALAEVLGGADDRDRGGAGAEALRGKLRGEALVDGEPHRELIAALDRALDDDSILVGDSTMACYYGAVHLLPRTVPRRFLYPTGFAPLGYAIPAAIGAKLGHPEHQVLALIGDGGAMFTLPELAVAVERELPIAVVVVNDGGYGEIRREMLEREQKPIGVDLRSPDFTAAAAALGARGETVDEPEALPSLLESAFAARGPTLIEIRLG